MNELKPCPFCGGEKIHLDRFFIGTVSAYCKSCEAVGPFGEERKDAIEAWNKRVQKPIEDTPVNTRLYGEGEIKKRASGEDLKPGSK